MRVRLTGLPASQDLVLILYNSRWKEYCMPEITPPPALTAANRANARPLASNVALPPAAACVTSPTGRDLGTCIYSKSHLLAFPNCRPLQVLKIRAFRDGQKAKRTSPQCRTNQHLLENTAVTPAQKTPATAPTLPTIQCRTTPIWLKTSPLHPHRKRLPPPPPSQQFPSAEPTPSG